MVSIRVEIKSSEMIKPSTTSPHRLKTLQLSCLDRMAPPVYIPLLFFYANEPSHPINPTELSILLKRSLSDTLARYYPLAGKIEGNNMSIDCNDHGVEYREAYVARNLSKIIENPIQEDLRELLPFEPAIPSNRTVTVGVQVNQFSCGGVAIALCVFHRIADGAAVTEFVNAWAKETLISQRVSSYNNEYNALTNPKFDSTSHFPPKELNGIFFPGASICKGKVVTKRFIFDRNRIDVLKGDASSQVEAPTKVEVVSAFIWKRVIEANRGNSGQTKASIAAHVVDLRSKRVPPIPRDSFGNFWWFTFTPPFSGEELKHSELVAKLRQGFRKINNDYIKTLQNGECPLEFQEMSACSNDEGLESCNFTSWCRFPLYEANFGWGKPMWVSTITPPIKNMVILLSTKCGEGIEAWVSMLEDGIAMLENDYELLALANP